MKKKMMMIIVMMININIIIITVLVIVTIVFAALVTKLYSFSWCCLLFPLKKKKNIYNRVI